MIAVRKPTTAKELLCLCSPLEIAAQRTLVNLPGTVQSEVIEIHTFPAVDVELAALSAIVLSSLNSSDIS